MTIYDFYTSVPEYFKKDMKWVIKELLNIDNYLDKTYIIEDKQFVLLNDALQKLQQNVPLAYILGYVPFYNCNIKVNDNVLIPRPETEQLCDIIAKEKPSSILDICTGSGCIAISLAKATCAKVTACDISSESISVAQENAKQNAVNVNFIQSDLLANIQGTFDIIVSNPPYLDDDEMKNLPESVRYEPKLALYGGIDGLDFYRKIANDAYKYLNKNGCIYLEVGDKQADLVCDIFSSYECEVIKDYFGFKRFVKARIKYDR